MTEAGLPGRPATIEETLSTEGMDETVTLTLVSFPDIRLPFSTYVRDGWDRHVGASGEGEAAMLTFGASRSQAVVHLFVPAGEPSAQEVMRMAGAVAEAYGNAVRLKPEGWSQGGYAFANATTNGQVRLGSHAGVSFYLIETYAPEVADGFVPAARVIAEQWRWADDGTGL